MITKGERRNRGESGNRTPSTYRARTRTVGYRKVQDRYSKARKGANQWRFYQKTTLTLTVGISCRIIFLLGPPVVLRNKYNNSTGR